MSNLKQLFPLDHRVFQGGRYLRAFDNLADIDHYEHSILTFLGSLMPFHEGFVDHKAWPSVATIAKSTKIGQTTVRKKMRSLQHKGYIRVTEWIKGNRSGKWQQFSNNYFLTVLAFEFYESVLESEELIGSMIFKRVSGDNFSCPETMGSPSSHAEENFDSQTAPQHATVANSSPISPLESPNTPDYSVRNIFAMKSEVDQLAKDWEKLFNFPVSKGEKEEFLREYARVNGNQVYYADRMLHIARCPYLTSRAKSLNYLFSPLDCAIKNREEIIKIGSLAILESRTEGELLEKLGKIPGYIRRKSHNYGTPTEAVIMHLLQDAIKAAKEKFGLQPARTLPKNDRELRAEIKSLLATKLPEDKLSNLLVILDAMKTLNFGYCLELYRRHSVAGAAQ